MASKPLPEVALEVLAVWALLAVGLVLVFSL